MRCRSKNQDPTASPFAEYAWAAQEELEERVVELALAAAKLVPGKRLCYSGRVALNIMANRRILNLGIYDDLFIQPTPSDAGIPLGAALYGYHCVLKGEKR